jgi:hypothetical protein
LEVDAGLEVDGEYEVLLGLVGEDNGTGREGVDLGLDVEEKVDLVHCGACDG